MAWWPSRRGARAERVAPDAASGIAPADLAELDVAFSAIEADEAAARDIRIAIHLRHLVERMVPARVVEAAPGLHAARVRFADGTEVLVQGRVPGDAAVLARWVRSRSIVALSCWTGTSGMELAFGAPGGHGRLAVRVTGINQPD